ncbi:hypothetical protein E2C01_100248 [Portunus trituberculatus]|uniref:Uncharacterized protein n=1 Tax=Portunus trituberculatus TaxID=210409 RepID=A0A5B7KCV0_PORTR|nr:hypothetical protein [Portunus trituberculatus]
MRVAVTNIYCSVNPSGTAYPLPSNADRSTSPHRARLRFVLRLSPPILNYHYHPHFDRQPIPTLRIVRLMSEVGTLTCVSPPTVLSQAGMWFNLKFSSRHWSADSMGVTTHHQTLFQCKPVILVTVTLMPPSVTTKKLVILMYSTYFSA